MAASLIVALASAPSVAAEPTQAEALFSQGRQAMKNGNLVEACADFTESQRLEPATGTLLNLAICEERRGNVLDAWVHFREVIATSGTTDDRVAIAQTHADKIEPSLARVSIVVLPLSAVRRVLLDGRELQASRVGQPIPVNPGEHEIVVVDTGGESHAASVRAETGRLTEKAISLPSKSAEPIHHVPPASIDHSASTAFFASGFVELLGSLALGAFAWHERQIVRDHCVDRACDQSGLQAGARGSLLVSASTLTFGLGVASMGAGAVLRVYAEHRESTSTIGAAGTF